MIKDFLFEDILNKVLILTKNKQMAEEEYRYIASFLGDKKFLVFGTGFDTELWRYSNKNGITIFLENNIKWIENNDDTLLIKYTSKIADADYILNQYRSNNLDLLYIDLPNIVINTKWDCIFVDSPEGWSNKCPGRMQSIYAASKLAGNDTDIFIHDCDRYVEDLFSREFFKFEIKHLKKLKHFRI